MSFTGTVTPHLWIIVYQHLIASNTHIFTGQHLYKIAEQIAHITILKLLPEIEWFMLSGIALLCMHLVSVFHGQCNRPETE